MTRNFSQPGRAGAKKVLKSFGFAFNGLRMVLSTQQNVWIHIVVSCLVMVAGIFARLTAVEWCIIVLTISLVLAMEIMNTAIEKLVDFVSPGFHEQAGLIKDISAAAVLLAAAGAVIAGLIIFVPKVF
ncbi:MAG: diacylglycerol kinase family protein [Bacteroidetes bacterium]|nr:diacylglycerol kinase family protein [Bacteroidota bacterium]